jgi:hypothetical protein
MTEGENPNPGNAGQYLTSSQASDRLASILESEPQALETIAKDENQEQPEGEKPESTVEPDAESEVETEGTDEQPETEDEEEAQESVELSDDFEIELEDGERITLAELKNAKKQAKEFQRDYTRKTQAVSDDRKIVEDRANAILAQVQQLQQERESFLTVVHEFLGSPPQRPNASPQEDPMAWMEYNAQRELYAEKWDKVNSVQQQREAEMQRQMQEREQHIPQIIEAERSKIVEKFPKLKDPEFAKKTTTEMMDVIPRVYGVPVEELSQVMDSRYVHILMDAMEYQRIKNAQPAVKEKVVSKPPLIKAQKRQSPAAKQSNERKELHDRHRKTGSKMDAVAILKALDL